MPLKISSSERSASLVTAALRSKLSQGSYQIDISAQGFNGHAMRFRSYFVIGAGPIVKQAESGSDTQNRASDILNRTGRPLGLVALIGIGVLFSAALIAAPTRLYTAAARCALYSVLVGMVALALKVGAVVAGAGRLGAILDTQAGRLMLLHGGALFATLWVAARIARSAPGSQQRASLENALAILGLILMISYSGTTRAAGDDWPLFSLLTSVVHISSTSIWLGGLFALVAAAHRGVLFKLPLESLLRLERLANWCTALAVASGAILALRLSGGLDMAAFADAYGASLFAKVILVAVLVYCRCQTNRVFRTTRVAFMGRSRRNLSSASSTVSVLSPTVNAARTAVTREAGLAIAVLIASAVLSSWAR